MTKYERINRKFEKFFFPRIKKPIQGEINAVTSIVNTYSVESAISYVNSQLNIQGLTTEVSRLHEVVGVRHGNESMRGLRRAPKIQKKGFGLNEEWIAFIHEYFRNHLIEKITFDVPATVREYLLRVLNRSIAEGWGVDETVRNLRGSMFSDFKAAQIVRTETNMAANAGVLAAGETYDYEMQKEWVSVHDFRTRGTDPKDHADHVLLDGTIIDFDDSFVDSRNGDRMSGPGDPKASAASNVNCRCNLTLKPKRDSRGRLIPKRKTTSVIYPNQIRQGQIITI